MRLPRKRPSEFRPLVELLCPLLGGEEATLVRMLNSLDRFRCVYREIDHPDFSFARHFGSPTRRKTRQIIAYIEPLRPFFRCVYIACDPPNFSFVGNFGSPTRRKTSRIIAYVGIFRPFLGVFTAKTALRISAPWDTSGRLIGGNKPNYCIY